MAATEEVVSLEAEILQVTEALNAIIDDPTQASHAVMLLQPSYMSKKPFSMLKIFNLSHADRLHATIGKPLPDACRCPGSRARNRLIFAITFTLTFFHHRLGLLLPRRS